MTILLSRIEYKLDYDKCTSFSLKMIKICNVDASAHIARMSYVQPVKSSSNDIRADLKSQMIVHFKNFNTFLGQITLFVFSLLKNDSSKLL